MNGTDFIKDILDKVVNIVAWPVFVFVVVVMFIYIGFLFLSSKGEPGKLQKAQHAAIWGIVGVAIGLLAFSVVKTIKSLLGIGLSS